MSQAQPSIPAGQVDIFMGVDFNYRDLIYNGRVYELLINLTPAVKWNMGKGWQAAAQALVPIVNHYGDVSVSATTYNRNHNGGTNG